MYQKQTIVKQMPGKDKTWKFFDRGTDAPGPPKPELLHQVKSAFNANSLGYFCGLPEDDFAQYAVRTDNIYTRKQIVGTYKKGEKAVISEELVHEESPYWFKDNGADILLVCHLDSVQKYGGSSLVTDVSSGDLIRFEASTLDDRLGAYTILHLLPALGIKADILLCTNEEQGRSTAEFFETEKKYNWIAEFDRAGDDVVTYDYESESFESLLEESGFVIGMGSFSDISSLSHVGCKAFNIGVGYVNYHSKNAHVVLEQYFGNVARFLDFYTRNKDTYLPHGKKNGETSIYGNYKSRLDYFKEVDEEDDNDAAEYRGMLMGDSIYEDYSNRCCTLDELYFEDSSGILAEEGHDDWEVIVDSGEGKFSYVIKNFITGNEFYYDWQDECWESL